jgi:site-specific DNA recombinase
MSKNNGKSLRFGALIRVSSEQQEQQGESLRTQRTEITRDVELLESTIVGWYGGQEHATPGWEKAEVDRLIADAGKGKFDAVIVSNTDRWSRDNEKSNEGLTTFRKHGIRFFVATTEYDLFLPEHVLFLGMSAIFGQFQASHQNRKSVLNRIHRAKRGLPTCGKLPFGRIWDDEAKTWAVDPEKQAMVTDVANRYLAGESLPKLAKEYGVNHSNLCKVLRERCGDQWEIEFRADDLNIAEAVMLTIPPLLPEPTIRAVRQRLEANRTYLHKPPVSKYDYLLSGRVFCAACGYSMFGQTNPNGQRYYRHAHQDRVRNCPIKAPQPWVRAEAIEEEVVSKLFDLLGNPAAIERAVNAAVPACEEALKQRSRLEEELLKVGRARDRVLGMIEKDAITDAQAEAKLRELQEREAGLRVELDRLAATLADVPDAETVRLFVEQWDCGGIRCVGVLDEYGNEYEGGNSVSSWIAMRKDDRPKLIDAALTGSLPDGTPAGVYVTPTGGARFRPKNYSYRIRGRLIEATGQVMPHASPSPAPSPP